MANIRVFRYLKHDIFGSGYQLTDTWPCLEGHYEMERVRVIDYVDRSTGKSVLSVFIPLDPEGTTYIEEWKRVRSMDWLKKAATARPAAANRANEVTDDAFATKHPALFAFMTASTSEGQPRELCKVQVFADAGVWKAALHDPNTEHSLFVTLGTPGDVWKALEKALTAETPEWRGWSKQTKRKK